MRAPAVAPPLQPHRSLAAVRRCDQGRSRTLLLCSGRRSRRRLAAAAARQCALPLLPPLPLSIGCLWSARLTRWLELCCPISYCSLQCLHGASTGLAYDGVQAGSLAVDGGILAGSLPGQHRHNCVPVPICAHHAHRACSKLPHPTPSPHRTPLALAPLCSLHFQLQAAVPATYGRLERVISATAAGSCVCAARRSATGGQGGGRGAAAWVAAGGRSNLHCVSACTAFSSGAVSCGHANRPLCTEHVTRMRMVA